MEDTFIYELRKILKYTQKKNNDADFAETGMIEFYPPSMQSFDEASDFEQIIMGAMVSAGRLNPGKDDKEDDKEDDKPQEIPTPDEIKAMLFAADINQVSVRKVAKVFRKLAVKTGRLDDNTRLKDSHIDKLDRRDFLDMLSGYASFFSLPSLLNQEGEAEKAGSE